MLPYGVGFLLLAGYALGSLRTEAGPPPRVIGPAAAFYALGVASCLIKVRHDELTDNPASLHDASWHAPYPVLLVVLVVVAVGLIAVGLSSRRPAAPGVALSPRREKRPV